MNITLPGNGNNPNFSAPPQQGPGASSPVFADQTNPQYGRTITGPSAVGESAPTSTDRSPFPLLTEAQVDSALDTIQRIYRPLDGQELANAIGEHVKQQIIVQLRNSGKIEPHLMYEQPIWRGEIAIRWKAAANNELGIIVQGQRQDIAEDGKPVEEAVVEAVHLTADTAPDTIREATGQPIPVMGKQPSGNQGVVRVPSNTFNKNRQGRR